MSSVVEDLILFQNNIQWRKDATHLLVYVTDAVFHYAGDGKLGGIVTPNNGHCYLDGRGRYTKANEMVYSILKCRCPRSY